MNKADKQYLENLNEYLKDYIQREPGFLAVLRKASHAVLADCPSRLRQALDAVDTMERLACGPRELPAAI